MVGIWYSHGITESKRKWGPGKESRGVWTGATSEVQVFPMLLTELVHGWISTDHGNLKGISVNSLYIFLLK